MDWVRQQSSKKGGVLLLMSLVWDGSFVSAAVHHHPADDLQDSRTGLHHSSKCCRG